jgi:uncharacterized protein YecT (DUF1311 family)
MFLIQLHRPGVAQHMNAPGAPCNKLSTTAQEASCFHKAAEIADQELNRLYARIRSVLPPGDLIDLTEAQRAWMSYRDLTCTAEYHLYGGGTGGPVTRLACVAAITQERTATLKTTYDWRLRK